jgi:hypothetical protein
MAHKSLAGNYQQQIGVMVKDYVDELTLILIDNFIFICKKCVEVNKMCLANYKEAY